MVWSMRAKAKTGIHAMIGKNALVIRDIDPEGNVDIRGESTDCRGKYREGFGREGAGLDRWTAEWRRRYEVKPNVVNLRKWIAGITSKSKNDCYANMIDLDFDSDFDHEKDIPETITPQVNGIEVKPDTFDTPESVCGSLWLYWIHLTVRQPVSKNDARYYIFSKTLYFQIVTFWFDVNRPHLNRLARLLIYFSVNWKKRSFQTTHTGERTMKKLLVIGTVLTFALVAAIAFAGNNSGRMGPGNGYGYGMMTSGAGGQGYANVGQGNDQGNGYAGRGYMNNGGGYGYGMMGSGYGYGMMGAGYGNGYGNHYGMMGNGYGQGNGRGYGPGYGMGYGGGCN
jgi:hypothetical protein